MVEGIIYKYTSPSGKSYIAGVSAHQLGLILKNCNKLYKGYYWKKL